LLLLFINKNIFIVGTPIGLTLRLLVFFLKRYLKKGLIVAYLKVKRLKVKLIFNKNVIKLGDNKEYIKEAINIIVIFCVK